MARYEFKLPDIGEGIAEAEIVAWHVKVGDTIAEDQQIADMMTDKATVEMESPVAGKVIELAGEVGDQVPIGSVLAVIETEGADRSAEPVEDSKDERPLADGAIEATPDQAEEVHAELRELLTTRYNSNSSAKVRILYGGSVKPSNAKDLLSQPNIDGALVGGASLNANDFLGIAAGASS